jgi:hypothetical protein
MIDAAKVEAAIASTEAALRELEQCLRLPLKPETVAEVKRLIERCQRRIEILRSNARSLSVAAANIEALLLDGYPELPTSDDTAAAADLDSTLADQRIALRYLMARGGG